MHDLVTWMTRATATRNTTLMAEALESYIIEVPLKRNKNVYIVHFTEFVYFVQHFRSGNSPDF